VLFQHVNSDSAQVGPVMRFMLHTVEWISGTQDRTRVIAHVNFDQLSGLRASSGEDASRLLLVHGSTSITVTKTVAFEPSREGGMPGNAV
jgi:hypothetical protein